ncbi:MAG: sigma-54-dependent transcriptional regulator [Syntrophales bacterium]
MKLLVVDDENLMCWSLKKEFEKEGFDVFTAGTAREGINCFKENNPEIVFLDVKLPDKNGLEVLKELKQINRDVIIIIITAFGGVENAVSAIKAGAYDYIEKPFEFESVRIIANRALETARLKKEVRELRIAGSVHYSFDRFTTCSANMMEVLSLAKKVAATDCSTVLIQGESGVGKDLLAKIIHYESSRATRPFMEISCTALPETLIESELFGFEKGAFTDAKSAKKGLFEAAEGGTVYMDEIGDVKPSTQVKLLRVLEEKTFKHIGGSKDISLDVRIIAATNRKLEREVEAGNFREDLFYRLKVLPIYIPPLRERKQDIVTIAMNIIGQLNREFKRDIHYLSKEAEELLLQYNWPGNVRELRNVIERVMILADVDADTILPDHLPLEIKRPVASNAMAQSGDATVKDLAVTVPEEGIALARVEKECILQALNMTNGNQAQAARLLKVTRDTLRYRMQKFGI